MQKVIEINKLSYSYPDGTKALESVALDIFQGESVAVIGPNGAGKSTLLLHLNGMLNGVGHVKILGKSPSKENLKFIRSKVGLVFQDPEDQLFMPTVFDDVSFGPINMGFSKEKTRENVGKALEEVDMKGMEERSSHHLSYGEKKRVSIATILSMEPQILALDEPSSNLDPKSRRELINLLNSFKITKIIASHDLKMILETCARAIILDKGKVVADGPTKSILSDKTLLESHSLELP